MGTTYTQTIEFSVWKEHTCSCCATVYRYLFKRTMKGQGGTPDAAARNAERAIEKALEKEVDQRPCPECGLFQPDMVATRRSTAHWWTLAASAAIPALLFILVLTDLISLGTASLVAAASAVPALVAHFLIDVADPNRNREANRKEGRRLAKNGDLWVPEKKQPKELADEPVGNGLTTGNYVCYALLAASVLAFLMPMALRVASGMRVNSGLYPEVVGPGDSPYVYFPDKINSVKGYWSGQPRVTVLNAAELGVPVNIGATSKSESWGNRISVKSSEKNSHPSLWAYLQIPPDPQLAGKLLKLKIDMNVRYPTMGGGDSFQETNSQFSRNAEITLSSPGAGKVYKGSFWLGYLGGCALLFGAGALLPVFCNQFKTQARETSIFTPESRRSRDPEPPALDDSPVPLSGEEAIQDAAPADRSRKRRRDEDYEEERPRRGRDRDDEEDDRPRKRRRDDY